MPFKVTKHKNDCGDTNCTRCPLHYCDIEMIEDNEIYHIGSSMGFKTEYQLDKWIEHALKTLEEANLRIKKENEPRVNFLH